MGGGGCHSDLSAVPMGQDGAARAAWQAGMENPPTDEDQIEYIRLSRQALAIQKLPGTR